MTLVPSPEALRAGPLAGQKLELLTERSVLLVTNADSFLDTRGIENGSVVTVRSVDGTWIDLADLRFPQGTSAHRFNYIGERQDDGFIAAPEGGWGGNPVPGRWISARFRDCFGDTVEGQELSDWYTWGQQGNSTVIAFRLAGEAVSIPEGEGGALRGQEARSVPTEEAVKPVVVTEALEWPDTVLARTIYNHFADFEGLNPEEAADSAGALLYSLEKIGVVGDRDGYPTEEPSPPVVGDLVERLEARLYGNPAWAHVNPDGREAAARIRELKAALEPFARLADIFDRTSMVEVCEPHADNPSPCIQPITAFSLARARTALRGAR